MLLRQRRTSPDPIANAIADVLGESADRFTREDREMMSWTEGLLTAAAVGPERTRPDEWARAVFGPEHKYEDAEEAQACVAMLALLYNRIVRDLGRMGADYTPFFLDHAEEGEGVLLGAEWAAGFLAGTQLRREAWDSLTDSKEGKLRLAGIAGLLTDGAGNSLFLKGSAEQVAAAQEDALQWLGRTVHKISEYWSARASRTEPAKIDPFRKIGRNEPCPCRSGKKYKKCCLGGDESGSWRDGTGV